MLTVRGCKCRIICMVVIRLQRTGRRNYATFRIVAIDSRMSPRSGRYIEKLGYYEPKQNDISINSERVRYWLSVGAQPSKTVHNFLVSMGIIDGPKKNVVNMKKMKAKLAERKAEEEANAPAQEEAPAEESASDEGGADTDSAPESEGGADAEEASTDEAKAA